MISSVFSRFVYQIYTFSCGTVLLPTKISSSSRLPVRKLFFDSNICNNHIFYEPNNHNPFNGHRAYLCCFEVVIFQAIQIKPATHSSDTAMAVPVFKLHNMFSILRNLPAKLLIEIAKPKMTALGCTPLIHRPMKFIHPSCIDVG